MLRTFERRGPAHKRCLDCNRENCAAWVALFCGGCNRTFWIEQSFLDSFWCNSCAFGHDFLSWQSELRQQTNLNIFEALQLFESGEQKILAYYRWELNHVIRRVEAQNKSQILSVRCRSRVPLTQHSQIGPLAGDPDQELDNCLKAIQQLNLGDSEKVRIDGKRIVKRRKRRKRR